MKTNDEYIESIYNKRDAKLRAIKKRNKTIAIIVPIFAVCVGIAALPGVVNSTKKAYDSAAPENFFYNAAGDAEDITGAESGSAATNNVLTVETECVTGTTKPASGSCPTESKNAEFDSINKLRKYLDTLSEADKAAIEEISLPLLDNKQQKLNNLTLSSFNDSYSITAVYSLSDGCEYTFICCKNDESALNDIYRSVEPAVSGKFNGADVTIWLTEVNGIYSGYAKVNGTVILINASGTEPEHLAEEIERFSYARFCDIP